VTWRNELKDGLTASYKHRDGEGSACAICGNTSRPLAFHVLGDTFDETSNIPDIFVPMSSSMGKVKGSYPICNYCAPACKKCGLPLPTEKVLEYGHNLSAKPGLGLCAHIKWGLFFSALFKRLFKIGRFGNKKKQLTPSAEPPITSNRGDDSDVFSTLVAEIKLVEDEYIEENDDLFNGFDVIRDDIKATIFGDPGKTMRSIEEDGLSPQQLIYLLITNTLDNHICSGKYHTYRGILSYKGQALLNLWDWAVDKMFYEGLHTEQQAEDDKNWVREQIKNVG
jgi:hypothetical protein